jgi:hypothetical protein
MVPRAEQKRVIIEPTRHPESDAENVYRFNLTMRTFGP